MYDANLAHTDVLYTSKEDESGDRKEDAGTRNVRSEQSMSTESNGSWHESFQTPLGIDVHSHGNHGDGTEKGSSVMYENLGDRNMKHNPMYAATQEDTDVISPSKEHEPGEVHSERKEGIGTRRVRFEQSISTESHGSWHESFQTSLEANNRQVNHGDVNEIGSFNKYENLGKYHTLEKEKKGAFKDGTDILISSGRDGNPIIRAMFGIISGLLTGAIFVVILRFTFDYTYFQAGIITVVYTVIVCIGLALSSICRCIMAVLVPNFFTGKGRVIILSIIFGVMLSGPIANISHNFKESGNSLACSIDLINTQLQVLQRKLEEPVKDMALYVNKQKEVFRIRCTSFNSGSTEYSRGN
ncbi:uncharacterized protein LOC127862762 [Dreissena polymorpha]|uniref:uncharacterized protein LOC127862762 n=1 Tax=Dreissena polymorpha TaxID=45954 RepID=UPI00226569E2|nr:uncharacterized protein LOC127862762 [Dreissena polymorpha]